MKSLNELRTKHWTNVECGFCPKTKSQLNLSSRYNHSEYAVDPAHMNEARKLAARAVILSWCGQEQKAEASFNMANGYLAGAMQVDGKNVEFWEGVM